MTIFMPGMVITRLDFRCSRDTCCKTQEKFNGTSRSDEKVTKLSYYGQASISLRRLFESGRQIPYSKPLEYLMKKNMGTADIIIRLTAAVILAVLYFANIVTGTAGIIMLVAGGVFIVTSLFRFCPGYLLFGISTCKVENDKSNLSA